MVDDDIDRSAEAGHGAPDRPLWIGAIVLRVDDPAVQQRSGYDLPPRFHLDLYAPDQDAEVRRLTGLGAREIPVPRRPADADWRLMEDPEGNRFDVVQL